MFNDDFTEPSNPTLTIKVYDPGDVQAALQAEAARGWRDELEEEDLEEEEGEVLVNGTWEDIPF